MSTTKTLTFQQEYRFEVDKPISITVMITGPTDVGKTSLSKLLLNYATRHQGHTPLFVDLDPSQGTCSIPGSICAASLDDGPLPVEHDFSSLVLGDQCIAASPLVYYYGASDPTDNPVLYKECIKALSNIVNKRLQVDAKQNASGVILDTPGALVQGRGAATGMETLEFIIQAFCINTVIVLGHERLYSDLNRLSQDRSLGLSIVKLGKSGGAVTRDMTYRKKMQMHRIREYFYGIHQVIDLSPYATRLSFDQVTIYTVSKTSLPPTSALPIGADRRVTETTLQLVTPGDILLHIVLAVVQPKEGDTAVYTRNVLGFVYVSQVNEKEKFLMVLCPSAGALPSTTFLMGEFKWHESH